MVLIWELYFNVFLEIVGKVYVIFNDLIIVIKNLLV